MFKKRLKIILKGVYPTLEVEDLFPHHIRKSVMHLFLGLCLILFVMIVSGNGESHRIRGWFLISLSVSLWFASLEAYFYSTFARTGDGDFGISFEIARLIFYADDGDLTRGFIFSDIGDEVMKRLGFEEGAVKQYLSSRPTISFKSAFDDLTGDISVEKYSELLLKNDKSLSDLLFTKGFGLQEFQSTLRWVVGKDFRKIEKERFWSRENIGRIPGIGKNWAYGETYTLEKYGTDLTESASPFDESYEMVHRDAVVRLESTLLRSRNSNAVVVSEDESSRLDVVSMLSLWIKKGFAMHGIASQRIFLLNPNLLIDNARDKITFERELNLILLEAQRAGNVILVFPEFSSFLTSALTLGSDVLSLISPFITSPVLHIIALDSKLAYHSNLSSRDLIASHFELIDSGNGSDEGLVGMIESEALKIESRNKIIITYPAVKAIKESVKRYFDLSSASEKAKDLLIDSVRSAVSLGKNFLNKEDVLGVVTEKTGVPTSTPKGEERNKLMHIDELMHKRVVGQDEAITALSKSIKESRADVGNPDKPIGTFLFLGPTGVGKTETAKALAEVYFGSEENISRLDMSEYRDNYAIDRLIGSFGSGKSGRLVELIKERPYGVLLLDEFEKATKDVTNVFLRVLDEGVVTDSEGRKINARNLVIIATSNAGSDFIWEIVKSGGDIQSKKQEVIDRIISEKIFAPELINRFDGVVLFHPLLKEDLSKVAMLMFASFSKRMREKGIEVSASDKAIQYVVSKGTDPKFGARPMQRAVAEEMERIVAERIIDGSIDSGSKVMFDVEDNNLVLN